MNDTVNDGVSISVFPISLHTIAIAANVAVEAIRLAVKYIPLRLLRFSGYGFAVCFDPERQFPAEQSSYTLSGLLCGSYGIFTC